MQGKLFMVYLSGAEDPIDLAYHQPVRASRVHIIGRLVLPLLALLFTLLVIPSKADQPLDVSMVQLIANPEKFDGKHIRVIGFLRIEFEGNALYFHREDYEIGLLKNAIWVDVTPQMEKQSSKFNMQYVLLEGIFSASEKGHMDAFSGSIKRINRVMPWPSRRSQ
jgi:hypothetical protein